MKYGYARVSTIDQKLESQIEQLKNAGAEEIFQEKFTGTTNSRPAFINLLNTLESGDTLIITKLDRFARNTREALATIQELFDKDIKIPELLVDYLAMTWYPIEYLKVSWN